MLALIASLPRKLMKTPELMLERDFENVFCKRISQGTDQQDSQIQVAAEYLRIKKAGEEITGV